MATATADTAPVTSPLSRGNGTVFYRLSLINQGTTGEMTNVALLDRLPNVGDGRGNVGSEWNAYFAENGEGNLILDTDRKDDLPDTFTVKLGDETLSPGNNGYELYFYTGDQNLTDEQAETLLEQLATDSKAFCRQ